MTSTFVALAAYREPADELAATLASLLDGARHDVRIGLVAQGCDFTTSDRRIDLLELDPMQCRGAGWARHLAHAMVEQETHVYQCDSHIRMIPHWDRILLDDLAKLDRHAVLTAFPAEREGDLGESLRSHQPIIHALSWERHKWPEPLATRRAPTGSPSPARGVMSASSVFGPAEAWHEVPYDPHYIFVGEELSWPMRAHARGWRMWTPTHQIQRHWYSRPERRTAWDDRPAWGPGANDRSASRLDELLSGRLAGVYGLSPAEIAAWEHAYGADLAARTAETPWAPMH